MVTIVWFLLTVNLLANEEHVQNDDNSTKYEIYTLNDYLSLGDKKRNLDELAYSKEQFEYFDKKFDDINMTKGKPIVLDDEYENILDVLKDEAFLKRFSTENLSFVIYEKNKMMPILFSKCGSCIGGTKYFMVLEKNILKNIIIDQVVYDLVEPIACEE